MILITLDRRYGPRDLDNIMKERRKTEKNLDEQNQIMIQQQITEEKIQEKHQLKREKIIHL